MIFLLVPLILLLVATPAEELPRIFSPSQRRLGLVVNGEISHEDGLGERTGCWISLSVSGMLNTL